MPAKKKAKEKAPIAKIPRRGSSPGEGSVVTGGAPQFQKAIDAVVAAISAKYGDGSVSRLSDEGAYLEIRRVIPTGLPALDRALGVGGIPLGRLIEVLGPESSGKTTLVTHIEGQAQRCGVAPYKADIEQSGLVAYDTALGVDGVDAIVSQLDTMEQVFDCAVIAIETFERMHTPMLGLWDSLAATPLKDEFKLGFDESARYPARAKYLSENLPKLVKAMKSGDVGYIIVNQLREKVGALPWQKQTYSPGGRALRHWAHLRIEMTPTGAIRKGSGENAEVIGFKTRAKIIKNKVAPPFREANLEVYFAPPRIIDPSAPKVERKPMV